MSTFVYANDINTTLAAAITTTTQTSVTLSSGTNLPTLSAGQILTITLNDAATQSVFEILYVTAISGATLTVTRGNEGTAAATWLVGDYAYGALTAGEISSFVQSGLTNGYVALSPASAQVGYVNIEGYLWTGGGGSTTPGDLTVSRTMTTGLLAFGTTQLATIDYGVTTASTITIDGITQVKATLISSPLTPFSTPAGLISGDIVAQNSVSSGALALGGATSAARLDYGDTAPGALTLTTGGASVQAKGIFSVTALYTANLPAGAVTGDFVVQRGSGMGLIWFGVNGNESTFDYGVSASTAFTAAATTQIKGVLSATGLTSTSQPAGVQSGDVIAQISAVAGTVRLGGSGGNCYLSWNTTVANALTIYTNSGSAYAPISAGVYTNASDERIKSNIQDSTHGLDTVKAITAKQFTLNAETGGARHFGFIAQQVRNIVPEAITEDENGYLGIKQPHLIAFLFKAVQELDAKFEGHIASHG